MFIKFPKINTLFLITTLCALTFFSVNTQAFDKSELKFNQKSKNEINQILQNVKDKDPQRPISKKLVKNINNSNEFNSDQENLKINFNLENRKVKLTKQNDDISISIPDNKEVKLVDVVDDKVIYSGENSKTDVIIESVDGGVRQVLNIKSKDTPSFYDFKMEMKAGYKLSVNDDGSAVVTKPNPNFNKKEVLNLPADINKETSEIIKSGRITVLSIAKPWAADNNKIDLKTWYTVENGNTLRQHIDFKNASFPVVADPLWCGNAINSVSWINRSGMWSASNYPTWCGAWYCSGQWSCWQESYDKTSYCAVWSGWTCVNSPWNKQWNTNQYWSLYNQFMCHADIAGGYKTPWNLEPTRPDRGYWGFVSGGCN